MDRENKITMFGYTIPIKPLTNYELLNHAKLLKIKNFSGVFMRDTLPKVRSKPTDSGIVNLDLHKSEGTHWVCYYYNNYFDSFGLPPPNEVVEYMKTPIFYNSNEIQDRQSVTCGHLCLYVLKSLSDGKSYEEVWETLV